MFGEGGNEIGLVAGVAVPEAFSLAIKHVEGLGEEPVVGGGPHLFVADPVGGQTALASAAR